MYRVINVQKNQLICNKDQDFYTVKNLKKLVHENENVIVGDFVDLEFKNNEYILKEVKSRKNFLYRPKVANIDFACFFYSLLDEQRNLFTLNKYLFYLTVQKINAIIVFTKKDVVKKLSDKILSYKKLGYKTFYLSNFVDDQDFEKFKSSFQANNLYVFTGISGVGKSTTINKLLGTNLQKTQDISKNILRGQNTTTSSKIFPFNSALIIDTPGFSSFNLINISKVSLAQSLNNFFKIEPCKYNDCLHNESANDCSVKNNLDINNFSFIYNDYLKLLKEIK